MGNPKWNLTGDRREEKVMIRGTIIILQVQKQKYGQKTMNEIWAEDNELKHLSLKVI